METNRSALDRPPIRSRDGSLSCLILYSQEITVYTEITQEAKLSWSRLLTIKIIYGDDSQTVKYDNGKIFLSTLDIKDRGASRLLDHDLLVKFHRKSYP